MVVIRLQRRGTKKAPHHRIVAMERQRPQGGRALEILGYYDPSYEPPKFSLDESRLGFWVSSGAQVSPALASLVKRFKKVSVATIKS
ncbi:MAG: 30S ribosomal protein S16 [Omnitrophica WOR_2 bacterium RIFCSPHIGHO2_02_FULL_67_20]|nr:MAG: 30S ribosomal protein S16 [Omnitrophica WOR_2 bacterium RIFCSPHIGHO2_02_FULL_67_20]